MNRLVIWRGLEGELTEAASVHLDRTGLHALGTQFGIDPQPYQLEYELDVDDRFVTRTFAVRVTGNDWSRTLDLTHDGSHNWGVDWTSRGDADLPAPGGDPVALGAALDCDLGLSPLTNLMPIRRNLLDRRPGSVDLVAAWVSVPDLSVAPYRQRYEHVRLADGTAVVRFTSLDTHEGFTSELQLDEDGLVTLYPHLARRVDA